MHSHCSQHTKNIKTPVLINSLSFGEGWGEVHHSKKHQNVSFKNSISFGEGWGEAIKTA
jgi:hypothetical protein